MKRSPINRSDPEVIREWRRRGVEAAQAKARKRGRQLDRKRERDDWLATVAIRVEPEYVTPIVTKRRGKVERVERIRRAPAQLTFTGRRKFNGQTIIARESDGLLVEEAFFRSSYAWHPPMIVARKNKAAAWTRVRSEMLDAVGYRCQAVSPGCRIDANHVHHVLPRGRGGKDDGSTPLLVVCFVCHQWIHEHPYAARERGWLA